MVRSYDTVDTLSLARGDIDTGEEVKVMKLHYCCLLEADL